MDAAMAEGPPDTPPVPPHLQSPPAGSPPPPPADAAAAVAAALAAASNGDAAPSEAAPGSPGGSDHGEDAGPPPEKPQYKLKGLHAEIEFYQQPKRMAVVVDPELGGVVRQGNLNHLVLRCTSFFGACATRPRRATEMGERGGDDDGDDENTVAIEASRS